MIGPLEAGRLVSSLSGYVETLVRAGNVGDVGDSTEGGSGRDDDSPEEGTNAPGRLLLEEWGGGGGVAGHVCQVGGISVGAGVLSGVVLVFRTLAAALVLFRAGFVLIMFFSNLWVVRLADLGRTCV